MNEAKEVKEAKEAKEAERMKGAKMHSRDRFIIGPTPWISKRYPYNQLLGYVIENSIVYTASP